MKNGGITIVDSEKEYAVKLSRFFKEKNGIGYDIQVFTDISSFLSHEENSYTDILLISDVFSNFIPDLKNYGQLFILTGGSIDVSFKEISQIYKYQSSELILKDVMASISAGQTSWAVPYKKDKAKVFCTYSPVKRCGKTTFSLIASAILAEKKRTLYLNFEDCSSLSYFIGTDLSSDISDLLYFFKQNPALVEKKLLSVVNSVSKLDYINPFRYTLDIKSMTGDEWCFFLNSIICYSNYDNIFLDLSDSILDVFPILNMSDVIYVPTVNDSISEIKVNHFFSSAALLENSTLIDKSIKISLPEYTPVSDGKTLFTELLYGDYGNFVREIVSNE